MICCENRRGYGKIMINLIRMINDRIYGFGAAGIFLNCCREKGRIGIGLNSISFRREICLA